MGRYQEKYWDASPGIHTPFDDGELYGCEITDSETGLIGTTHRARSSKTKAYADAWEDLMQKQKDYYNQPKVNYQSTTSESISTDQSGCAKIIMWIAGIGLAVFVVVWLAFNVVLPVALLNSALLLTVLAIIFKQRRSLFAFLALVGGCYMLFDIFNGWLSVNFVDKVVKDPGWVSAFVYINSAAIGLDVWFLAQPIWSKINQMEFAEKRKGILFKIVIILLVVFATSVAPTIYQSVQNPFVQKRITFNFFKRSDKYNSKNENHSNFVVIINADAVRGRTNPDKNANNVVFRLEKGIVLDIVDELTSPDGEAWVKVKYGTKQGWVSSSFAIKNIRSEQLKSTDNEVQFKKMQFISYGCGDNCYLTLKNLQTNQDESFMFWSQFGLLSELGWDEEGNIEKKFQGNFFEVTLNKKYMEWSTLIGNEMVNNKELVWYVVEMLPL